MCCEENLGIRKVVCSYERRRSPPTSLTASMRRAPAQLYTPSVSPKRNNSRRAPASVIPQNTATAHLISAPSTVSVGGKMAPSSLLSIGVTRASGVGIRFHRDACQKKVRVYFLIKYIQQRHGILPVLGTPLREPRCHCR